eukprot:2464056-Rhodomonas_salina.2
MKYRMPATHPNQSHNPLTTHQPLVQPSHLGITAPRARSCQQTPCDRARYILFKHPTRISHVTTTRQQNRCTLSSRPAAVLTEKRILCGEEKTRERRDRHLGAADQVADVTRRTWACIPRQSASHQNATH